MLEVGIRELKNSFSKYIKRVRDGETIVVTDHGAPVAKIIQVGVPDDIAALLREGAVTWSGHRPHAPRKLLRLKPGPQLSDYVIEDRD